MTVQETWVLTGTVRAREGEKEKRGIGIDGDKERGGEGGRKRNMQGMVGDDAAHRQTAPTGHCLLCLHWTIVSVPINLLPLCARAGKDGRIQNDRHGLVTWEVRSGFNRGLGAVGTLVVWQRERGGRAGGKLLGVLSVRERDGESVSACIWMGGGYV